MEEEYFKISMEKVFELRSSEIIQDIRRFYLDKLGKATADMLDAYEPKPSEILKLFTR